MEDLLLGFTILPQQLTAELMLVLVLVLVLVLPGLGWD
jgi:hypothetical protein